jgi:eukaryotic-like serine/threonine-protein kinase
MLEPGSTIGRYRLERVLGEGAMGLVYLALDPQIDRRVAIKVLRSTFAGGVPRPEIEARFLKEAKLAGRLQHANIVTIYDVGRDGDVFFIAMEYVEGEALSALLRKTPGLSDAEKIRIARQTADALAHAHERQIIHRDIKPGNILVRADGVVKVSDFGIGKLLSGSSNDMTLTRTGQMLGSPSYMSPEQVKGETLDGRADLFALGVMLYEMLTGSRPFAGSTITTVVYQILHTQPPDPLTLRPEMPAAVGEVLTRALQKRREDRYPDARTFAGDLDRLAADLQESIPTIPSLRGAEPAAQRAPAATQTRPGAPEATVSTPTASLAAPDKSRFLFGVAAVTAAAALLLFAALEWRRASLVPAASWRKAASAAAAAPGAAAPAAPPASTPSSPDVHIVERRHSRANASEPAARKERSRSPEAPAASPEERTRRRARAAGETPEPERPEPRASIPPAAAIRFDNVYRARRAVQFQIDPDQARLTVDGRYVGIADDWDNHGGGKVFPFSPGTHIVRATLPGYRDLTLQIVISPSEREAVADAGDEMQRIDRTPYTKIPKLDYATTGGVIFAPGVAGAEVRVDGHPVGKASEFTPAHPLHLDGPSMHDLVLSKGSERSETIRVLVAADAGRDLAVVKAKLKDR